LSSVTAPVQGSTATVPFYNNPIIRSWFFQIALLVIIGFLIWSAATNANDNMRAANIKTGFGFFSLNSGFDINQHLIPYDSNTGTYGKAFLVGLINTLLVAVVGIFFATLLGFTVGVARLSSNWVVSKLAKVYVEAVRNVPLFLQLLFWYNAVLKPLPNPRDSFNPVPGLFVNNRGLFVPHPNFESGSGIVFWAFVLGIIAAFGFHSWAKRQQVATGKQYPVLLIGLGLIVGLPIIAFFLDGMPIKLELPELRGFNFRGGLQIFPEFVALVIALVIYTAAFIAEIVRAGIVAVSKGQTEAAHALGLRPGPTLNLVVIPQAMRVIVPPLTSQYLNLTKNSSLAVAIGYPDLVQIFAGTVLNQTGQALEVIFITMLVYLVISLVTSLIMNIYNRRVAIIER